MKRLDEDAAHLELALREIGESFGRFRLPVEGAERAMASSLQRYGQISPVVVCEREGRFELIDGFKRLAATKMLEGIDALSARVILADDRVAKAAMCALNRGGGRLGELEEAWIVQALVREDGLSQLEVADLLGRHKSWVCRRLQLIERLCVEARDELSVGLLSATTARELVRLPAGNQAELLPVMRREALNRDEVRGVVDLLLTAADGRARAWVLQRPREALVRERAEAPARKDPRLSPAGNRVARQLGLLLEAMPRMENWLRSRGRIGVTPTDITVLAPGLVRLSREARSLAEASEDFVAEEAVA
jgi:ParB-like chromosome segregation protein Spo0J